MSYTYWKNTASATHSNAREGLSLGLVPHPQAASGRQQSRTQRLGR